MTDQPQQFNANDALNKAREQAQANPEHARSFIDKVEDFVDQKTGGKYAAQVDQAGDWVEGQLGLPNNTNNPEGVPGPAGDPAVDGQSAPGSVPPVDPPAQPDQPTAP